MKCDRAVVMDEGEIVAVGTHKQLLNECEIYQELYRSQLGGAL
jgi:ATP-binding cassette subfamily B protein